MAIPSKMNSKTDLEQNFNLCTSSLKIEIACTAPSQYSNIAILKTTENIHAWVALGKVKISDLFIAPRNATCFAPNRVGTHRVRKTELISIGNSTTCSCSIYNIDRTLRAL